MKHAIAILLVLLTGCASVQQEAQTTTGNGMTNRVTKTRVHTLFDAKQVIASLQSSNGSTHKLGAAGVDQETTSEGFAKLGEAMTKAFLEHFAPIPKK